VLSTSVGVDRCGAVQPVTERSQSPGGETHQVVVARAATAIVDEPGQRR
jgi:hypothetical protein